MKYLNDTGLGHLISKIKSLLADKVDVVEGKGLSTNDYTTAEKTKLGALPTKSDLDTSLGGKVDKVSGKGLSTNDYTTAEKTKLSGIAEGAEVNVISTIKVNNTALTPSSKAVNIDLTGYALKSDIASVYKVKGSTTWAVLIAKTDAQVGDVYNVTDKGGANYVCTVAQTAGADSWDKLGETVDLSEYAKKSYVDTEVGKKADASHSHAISDVTGLQTALDGKSATGHGHEIADVSGLQTALNAKANDADLKTVAKTGAYSDLTGKPTIDTALSDTSTNAVQNKAIKSALDGKASSSHNHDDRYYTESEMDTKLGAKVNTSDLVAITTAEIDAEFAK